MDFNDHSNLRGTHALLSPSNYHWLNYDDQKLRARLTAAQAAMRGTRLHNWAHEGIRLGMRQKENGATVNTYINDGIRHRMETDVMLFYSMDAYGEADTLSFRIIKGRPTLRIHDLKTGLVKAGITQLEIYAALFYLEYGEKPEECDTLLFIYQNDQIIGGKADPARIRQLMQRTIEQNRKLNEFRKEM